MHWQDLSDVDRQREYSPSSCVGGDISEFLVAYADRSEQARSECAERDSPVTEIRYGPEPAQTVDLVVPVTTDAAGDTPPLIVFIHGGYWQQLSKVESFFAATGALDAGAAFAAIDYTLAPHATLDEIVAECRQAVVTLRDGASEHGYDAGRMVVCGSSAGAHLSAMMGLGVDGDGWRPAAVALVSGVFELEPLIGTTINDAVGLDTEAAHRNSPLLADLAGFPRTLIAYGDNETEQFKRQSGQLAEALHALGIAVEAIEVADRNHFDVILELCDPATPLGRRVLDLR